MGASIIGVDPDYDVGPQIGSVIVRMQQAGFTQLVDPNRNPEDENDQLIFSTQSGGRIILSANSIEHAHVNNAHRNEPPDSPANLRASLEMSMAAKATLGAEGGWVCGPTEQSIQIQLYAAHLAGLPVGNPPHAELDQATKDQMDKIWEEMHGRAAPAAAPAPAVAAAPAGPGGP